MAVNFHAKVNASRAFQLRLAVVGSEENTRHLEDLLIEETHRSRPKPLVDAIVMSGPSGVGKGTLINRLMKDRPGVFAFCVSHTSRAPREGEVHGVNYHFAKKEDMMEMSQSGEFLECCEVHGNMYGTSLAALRAVQKSGRTPIIEIDVQGAQKLRAGQSGLRLCFIFIEAPSMQELEERIVGRGQEVGEKVKTRLATAVKEMDFVHNNRAFFDKILTNIDLEESLQDLHRYFVMRCGV